MNTVMNPIEPIDPRRRQPMPGDAQQASQKQQIMQALINPAQAAFQYGRNFDGMFAPPMQQAQPQPQYQQPQPQNAGEGIAAMGDAVAHRQRQKQGAFPAAPGNSPLTGFGRLMGMMRPQGLR